MFDLHAGTICICNSGFAVAVQFQLIEKLEALGVNRGMCLVF